MAAGLIKTGILPRARTSALSVWDHLDRERNKRQPTSKEEPWDVLQEAWRNIPEDYLKKLQKACLRGFRLLKSKGAHTNYRLSTLLELSYFASFAVFTFIFTHAAPVSYFPGTG